MSIKHRTIAKGVLAALKLTGVTAMALSFIMMLVLAGCAGKKVSVLTWTAVSDGAFFRDSYVCNIAYGGGKFVAADDKGRMAYSVDGVTWTEVDNKLGLSSVGGIAWGGAQGQEKFVVANRERVGKVRMMYSADGVTWTEASDSKLDFIDGIAWGGDKFVVGFGGGKIAYSADGVTWTEASDSKLDSIRGIGWGGGKFVAGDDKGRMAYSADGVTWTAVDNKLGLSAVSGIAWGGAQGQEKFVAGACRGNVKDIVVTSRDGKTWTEAGSSPWGNDDSINLIAWGGGQFVAANWNNGFEAYSADGKTWTVATNGIGVGGALYGIAYGIAYGGGKFVAGGESGKMAYSTE
jgi:hypothetical protein